MFAELVFVAVGALGLCECGFVRAELVIDHLPDHFVVLHGDRFVIEVVKCILMVIVQ